MAGRNATWTWTSLQAIQNCTSSSLQGSSRRSDTRDTAQGKALACIHCHTVYSGKCIGAI